MIWVWIIVVLGLVAEAEERAPMVNGNSTLQTRRLRTRARGGHQYAIYDKSQGATGGQWTAETHFRKYGLNIDSGLVTLLAGACEAVERRMISSCKALEFGCGIGVYVNRLKSQGNGGRLVVGMEPEPMGGVFNRPGGPVQSTVNILDLDPVTEYPKLVTALGGPFHLVYSIEVAEHIPRDRHADVAAWLFAAADPKGSTLIFSAGHPGQKGTGHIGNRDRAEWRMLHEAAGWVTDEQSTLDAMRAVDRGKLNHQRNIMVLTRNLTSGFGKRNDIAEGMIRTAIMASQRQREVLGWLRQADAETEAQL